MERQTLSLQFFLFMFAALSSSCSVSEVDDSSVQANMNSNVEVVKKITFWWTAL